MAAPFEGLFGNTSELKVIQFLLPLKGLEFNISELARGTGVSRQTMVSVTKKLAKWNVLKLTSKHGNANYYAINEESGFIEAFEGLNNCIIEQMLGDEELGRIAEYSLEHVGSCALHQIQFSSGYITGMGNEISQGGWLRPSPEDCQPSPAPREISPNPDMVIDFRGNHATAA